MRRQWTRFFILATTLSLLVPACERDTAGLAPARPLTDPLVFQDDFGNGVTYQAFLGSKLDAIEIVKDEKSEGAASLKVIVPRSGDAGGGFAGGACPTSPPRYLVEYNALTFWAAASEASTFDVVGFGNDNTGFSKYTAQRSLPLTEAWQKFVVPIPLSGKLVNEAGMFFFADGSETGGAINVWFDDIRFEKVPGISNPRPSMRNRAVRTFVGATVQMRDTQTAFNVTGSAAAVDVSHMPGYFTFFSSNEMVAEPIEGGVQVVGVGNAAITAKLGDVDATGTVSIFAQPGPTTPATPPTLPQQSVISMFSNAYNDVPIDTWLTNWSQAELTEFRIAGDDVKAYTNVSFAGIEFINPTIDATLMTHFHIDVWLSTGSTNFKLKFVDFGEDGKFGGGDPNNPDDPNRDSEFEISGPTPLPTGSWFSLYISLDELMRPQAPNGLRSRSHLAQLIISGTRNTVFVDNLYYYRESVPGQAEERVRSAK